MATESKIDLHVENSPTKLDLLEPLWNALQRHHSEILPSLGDSTPHRDLAGAWSRRRAKYERWLQDSDSFYLLAEVGKPVGYAFLTVGPGYASWATGDRLAELETLSVLPEYRNGGIGADLLEAAWAQLGEMKIEDLVVMTALTNVDSHRFYERHGFKQGFVTYYRSHRAET